MCRKILDVKDDMKLLEEADLARLVKEPCVAETQLFLAELSRALPPNHFVVRWWGPTSSSPEHEVGPGPFAVCTVTLTNNTCRKQFRDCAGNFFFATARHTEYAVSQGGGRIDIRPRVFSSD